MISLSQVHICSVSHLFLYPAPETKVSSLMHPPPKCHLPLPTSQQALFILPPKYLPDPPTFLHLQYAMPVQAAIISCLDPGRSLFTRSPLIFPDLKPNPVLPQWGPTTHCHSFSIVAPNSYAMQLCCFSRQKLGSVSLSLESGLTS